MRSRTKRVRFSAGIAGVVLGLSGLLSTTVFASPFDFRDPDIFELDGDALTQGAGDDWDKVQAGTDSALASTFVQDAPPDGTYFTQGSKDTDDINRWVYATDKGGVPDKNEIMNAYAAAYVEDGNLIVYFGMDRYANDGSAELGFWFFQDDVGLKEPNKQGKGGFTGRHKIGDILVLTNFTQGGAVDEVLVYEWVGGKDPLSLIAQGADCGNPNSIEACALVNQVEVPSPWPYTPKSGTANTFPPRSFFEGGINLTEIFGGNDDVGCFSSFMGSTRSSHSLTASLHDLALGDFDLCDARVAITPAAGANQVGDDHDLTISVQKRDNTTNFTYAPAAGVDVTAKIDSGPGAFKDDDDTCTTNAAGECTVTIVSSTTGLTTVSASANVAVNGSSLSVKTDGKAGSSDPAKKRWVDAKVTLTPDAANQVGDDHTFTAKLEIDKGLGVGFAGASGEEITFSIESGPGNLKTTSCTTNVGGTCTVVLESSDTGLTTVKASWADDVQTAEGLASASASDTAVKRWVDARLGLTPLEDTNPLESNHTFTAKLEFDTGSGWFDAPNGETVTFRITNGPGSFVGGTNTCDTAAGDGTCTVQITSSVVGTTKVDASWSGDIVTAEGTASATADSNEVIKHWIDPARGQLTPTGTECRDFRDETAADQEFIEYTRSSNKGTHVIQNATPGVFIYWVEFPAPAASFDIDVSQVVDPNFKAFAIAEDGPKLFDADCNRVHSVSDITTDGGQVSLHVSGAEQGTTYYLTVKYDSQSLKDEVLPNGNFTAEYTFGLELNGGAAIGTDSLELRRK